MKNIKKLGALLCSACLVVSGTTIPTMADSMKVVTLGADLTDAQKNTMMKYFNVSSDQVQILTITNQDERDHLSAYVPIEQIGTRTVSCAYVKPTTSGGIKVRTANLNWVTCNMIATSLSTSGVKNCEVVAACPFEVSGTGALTGIQMAYETATGEQLDSTKKELATEEMVVTGNLADEVGKNDATTVMNNSKMQVIQNNVQNADDIYNIVVNVAQQNNVTLDSDQDVYKRQPINCPSGSWSTVPTWAESSKMLLCGASTPSTIREPVHSPGLEKGFRPLIQPASVLLPLPEGPAMRTRSPG